MAAPSSCSSVVRAAQAGTLHGFDSISLHLIPLNMCLLKLRRVTVKQVNRTGKVQGSSWPHTQASGKWPDT